MKICETATNLQVVGRINAASCENATAIYELLRYAEAEHYQEQLTEMWEGWLTNPSTDGYNADQRAEMLAAYKYLKEFLERVSL